LAAIPADSWPMPMPMAATSTMQEICAPSKIEFCVGPDLMETISRSHAALDNSPLL
jgi:hypothetical protein